eukprot:1268400-Pleurochrysis_carterae.AAC.2
MRTARAQRAHLRESARSLGEHAVADAFAHGEVEPPRSDAVAHQQLHRRLRHVGPLRATHQRLRLVQQQARKYGAQALTPAPTPTRPPRCSHTHAFARARTARSAQVQVFHANSDIAVQMRAL